MQSGLVTEKTPELVIALITELMIDLITELIMKPITGPVFGTTIVVMIVNSVQGL